MCAFVYKSYYDRLPGTIILETKKEQVLSYDLPVKGQIYLSEREEFSEDVLSESVSELNFNSPITMIASKPQNYIIKTKLFGFIPFKNVDISVVDEVLVIPVGVPVGIYTNTEGLLVVQTGAFKDQNGDECEPCKKSVYAGDYILQQNQS